MTRLPHPLELVRRAGLVVFDEPNSANLVAIRGPGGPGDWDGLLTLSYRLDETGGWFTRSWPCATRPGLPFLRSPVNPAGTATIALGQHRGSHRRGFHRGRPALVQVATVKVLRDPDRDAVYEPCVPGTGSALNIHDVTDPDDLAGCLGLIQVHLAELLGVYDLLAVRQGPVVSLSVVEG